MKSCVYSIVTIPAFFTKLPTRLYYKNGREIARSCDGHISLLPSYHSKCELTRAQGFRYWEKHFPDRSRYTLPQVLQEAVDKPSHSFGQYVSKQDGALIGYEG